MAVSAGTWRVVLAVLATGSWMFISSYLILLNKHIMLDLGFKYPMTVAGMGMLTSGGLSYMCCRVLRLVEDKQPVTFHFWVNKILPVGLFMALSLWTGNAVYFWLSVAFIQMLKAFTPVITMVCLFTAGLEQPNRSMIMSVLLITLGTAVATFGEVNRSIIGLVLMMSSETFEAIRLVMTQWLLCGLKFHPIEGLMYLAPACSVWLLGSAVVFEFPRIRESGTMSIMYEHPLLFVAAAGMGFMVNTLAYTSIKLASSLTLKVLGTVKNALLIAVSVIFLGDPITVTQAIGYGISIAGFGWYNRIKMAQIASQAGDPSRPLPPVLPIRSVHAHPSTHTRRLTVDGLKSSASHLASE